MSKHQITSLIFCIVTICCVSSIYFFDWSLWVLISIIATCLFIVVLGSFKIQLNYHLNAVCKIKTNKKQIALTFDDGPSEYTENVLQLLQQYNCKATFFCIGKNILSFPEIVQKTHHEGHQIANHTYAHEKIGFTKTKNLIEEIRKTDDLIYQYTGKKNTFFRPPFGVTNPSIRKALQATGHTVIGWNIRSLDTAIESADKITAKIKKKLSPGSIVLLHDTSERTILVLEQLLPYLQAKKYVCQTIETLIQTTK